MIQMYDIYNLCLYNYCTVQYMNNSVTSLKIQVETDFVCRSEE